MKYFIVFALVALVAAASACPGCPTAMDTQEAKHVLEQTLTILGKMDGPYYKFATINSATKQVVAGIKYTINVDLVDTNQAVETCNVVIVEQAWMGSTVVSFECPNKPQVVKHIQTN